MIVLKGARYSVDRVLISPDARILLAPCPGAVQVWDRLVDGSGPTAHLPCLMRMLPHFTTDGKQIVIGRHTARGSAVLLYELATKQEAELLRVRGSPSGCAIHPDGRSLILGARGMGNRYPAGLRSVSLVERTKSWWPFSAARMKELWAVDTSWDLAGPLFLDATRFLTLELESTGQQPIMVQIIRDARTGQPIERIERPPCAFSGYVVSTNGRLLAGPLQNRIAIIRIDDPTHEVITVRNDSRKHFTGLAFHPSGRYLAATSNDKTVKFYDTATWRVVAAFDWDIGRLRSITFSPDGTLAVAGGDKGRIVLWDVDL
jgi:WD40 repeat protein